MIDLTATSEPSGTMRHPTHMDLFYEGNIAPLKSLITRGIMLDISADPTSVRPENIPGFGLIESGCSVVLRTGWERFRSNERYMDCPWVDKALVHRLVALNISLLLIDAPGIYGGAAGGEHNEMDRYLADNRAFAVENLVNCHELPSDVFTLYCFPIYKAGANSAPCRVIAELQAPREKQT